MVCASNVNPRFALVAGEPSGDLLAGLLLQAMRQRWPDMQAAGIGGPRMVQQGFDAWWPQRLLAVRGYVEVLPHVRRLLAIRRALTKRLLIERPSVFIGIDAPDFNFDLEARLKRAGIPIIHFVSPSFWAWRAKKVKKLERAADHVLCIFPFEPALLAQHGVAATYVGHPLASVIPMQPDRTAARQRLGLAEKTRIVALLPGSRESEIKQLAGLFFQAARRLQQGDATLHFVVPTLAALRPSLEHAAQMAGLGRSALTLLDGQSHTALAACDVALVASGTATLEAALFKRPMVIAYHMPWLSWQLMRRKQLQPWVGLPNILCGEFVVPELLQQAATPAALAQAVQQWLQAPEKVAVLQRRFATLHAELQRDTAGIACDVIESLCAPSKV